MSQAGSTESLRHFTRPFPWPEVDEEIDVCGGAILDGFLDAGTVTQLHREFDAYLAADLNSAEPDCGSTVFNDFLGHRTLRVQNLVSAIPGGAALVANQELVDWSDRAIDEIATGCILNSGELIQIGPGEIRQRMHRDATQWPSVVTSRCPLMTNAIIALDPFTVDNGATHVVPGSAAWTRERHPEASETVRALMAPGDALLISGNTLHGGGANGTEQRRRAISLSYCPGWLRPIENNVLNFSLTEAARLNPLLQRLLGFGLYDGGPLGNSVLGVCRNYRDPAKVLDAMK